MWVDSSQIYPDAAIEIYQIGEWRIIAASYRGRQHIHQSKPRQDAFSVRVEDDCICIAVADGLSAAEFSNIGAEFAVTHCRNIFLSEKTVSAVEYIRVFDKMRACFKQCSTLESNNQRDYATTIQIFKFFESGQVNYIRLGDGGCIIYGENTIKIGGKDIADIGVSNLSDPNCSDNFVFSNEHITEKDVGFMIYTDGVEPLFEQGGVLDTQNIARLFISMDVEFPKAIAMLNKLLNNNDADMNDDKTIVIGTRSSRLVLRKTII